MNRYSIHIVTLILMCTVLIGPAHAAKTLVVAVNPHWPPMEMKDRKGKLTGYEIDLINAVGKEAGFRAKLVEVPWGKIFKNLESGKCDAVMASVSITDGRKEKFDFSMPYFTVEQLIVVPRAKAGEDLKAKNIAAFKLTTGAEAIRLYQKVSITFYTVEETDKAFKDLSRGYLDGVLCDSPVAIDYALTSSKYKNKFAIEKCTPPEGVSIPEEEYGIAVRKGDAEVLALINQGLQSVMDKGIEDRIRAKWIRYPENQ